MMTPLCICIIGMYFFLYCLNDSNFRTIIRQMKSTKVVSEIKVFCHIINLHLLKRSILNCFANVGSMKKCENVKTNTKRFLFYNEVLRNCLQGLCVGERNDVIRCGGH